RALESLSHLATAISAKLGAGMPIMEQLANSARELLGMSRSAISLVDGPSENFRIYAYSGEIPLGAPRTFTLENMPQMQRAMAFGEIFMEEDARREGSLVSRKMATMFIARALMVIPL